jgi:hypothetical protein
MKTEVAAMNVERREAFGLHLNKEPTLELVRSGLTVPPDTQLPGGWNISVDGYPIPLLPIGKNLALLIHERRDALSQEDRNNPSFATDCELWKLILDDERQARVEAFEGMVRPFHFYKAGRHTWWQWRS